MKITKATRFQIIKPLDASWEVYGKVLNDLSYQTTRMCNAAVQMYWEYHNTRLQYKQEHGKYPQDKDLFSMSFRNLVYHRLREIYPLMASSNASQTNQFALNRWKNDVKEIMRLQKSIPSFRLGTPIQVANSNYRLYVTEGDRPEFRVDVTLLGKEAEKGRFSLLLDGGDTPKKAIFRRVVEGTYKQGVMQIVKNQKKKKWFCMISYTFIPEAADGLNENRAMGVNFAAGDTAVCWAFSFSPKRGSIPMGEIEAAQKKIAAITTRRKEMQRTAGTTSHGRQRRMKATAASSGKTSHIRDAINHKYSRKIVQIAVANKCGVIRLADPAGVKNSWPWADLVEKIKYKAEEQCITVQTADRKKAEYTCCRCGYSNPENIEGNIEFMCCKNPDCRAKINMEYNTAATIATGL